MTATCRLCGRRGPCVRYPGWTGKPVCLTCRARIWRKDHPEAYRRYKASRRAAHREECRKWWAAHGAEYQDAHRVG